MIDFSEIELGYNFILNFFNKGDNRERFINALDQCVDGVAKEALGLFDQWWHDIRFNTYITSVSEHDGEEDFHGRLSMWRAFGANVAGRVAIVIKIPFISEASQALNLQFNPIAHFK